MDEARRLATVDGIRRAIALYAQLLDSGRIEEWGRLFVEDARLVLGGGVHVGRAAIQREIGGMQPPPDRPVMHVCLLPVIDLEDADRARAWTDFSAFSTDAQGCIGIAAIGRYYDSLVRIGGGWRFAERAIVLAHEAVPEALPPSPAS